MKATTNLPCSELTATMKLKDVFGDGKRTCDLTFASIASSTKLFMMESDARQLAEWILDNTKPSV